MKKIEGHDFDFLFKNLTDEHTKQKFPSKNTNPYLSNAELCELKNPLSRVSHSGDALKLPREFTAVLYDNKGKAITCRVTVLPTPCHSVDMKDREDVHFGVCIQKLFIEDTKKKIRTSFGVCIQEPFIDPSKISMNTVPIQEPFTNTTIQAKFREHQKNAYFDSGSPIPQPSFDNMNTKIRAKFREPQKDPYFDFGLPIPQPDSRNQVAPTFKLLWSKRDESLVRPRDYSPPIQMQEDYGEQEYLGYRLF
jgi:hypothetical protein